MKQARQMFWKALQRLNLVKPRKGRFQVFADAFIDRVRRSPAVPPPVAPQGAVGVLVVPWMQSAVPLYSLEYARRLAAAGVHTAIIWDPQDVFSNIPDPREVGHLERVLEALRDEFEIIRVPEDVAATGNDPAFFEELVFENAVKKMRGEAGAAEFVLNHPELVEQMRAHIFRVQAFLKTCRFDWLLLPGGIWATSGIYACVASELGISITTFDCGTGSLFLSHDGAAGHFPGIQPATLAVEAQCRADPEERKRVSRVATDVLRTRMQGTDEYRLQPVAASTSSARQWDIVMALNLRWDSAAMLCSKLFPNVGAWLSAVLRWVEATPGVTLAIRQHPCERLEGFAGSDDFSRLPLAFPGLGERVRFFGASDDVNTYDLIAGAKVMLPYTSRVGIEAVMLGTPAVLCTKCYYGDCGFAETPSTAGAYFALIEQAIRGDLPVPEEARRTAEVAYYLAETCMEMRTSFTPAPTDFMKWVKQPADEIWNSSEGRDLLHALISRNSIEHIRHERQARKTGDVDPASVS